MSNEFSTEQLMFGKTGMSTPKNVFASIEGFDGDSDVLSAEMFESQEELKSLIFYSHIRNQNISKKIELIRKLRMNYNNHTISNESLSNILENKYNSEMSKSTEGLGSAIFKILKFIIKAIVSCIKAIMNLFFNIFRKLIIKLLGGTTKSKENLNQPNNIHRGQDKTIIDISNNNWFKDLDNFISTFVPDLQSCTENINLYFSDCQQTLVKVVSANGQGRDKFSELYSNFSFNKLDLLKCIPLKILKLNLFNDNGETVDFFRASAVDTKNRSIEGHSKSLDKINSKIDKLNKDKVIRQLFPNTKIVSLNTYLNKTKNIAHPEIDRQIFINSLNKFSSELTNIMKNMNDNTSKIDQIENTINQLYKHVIDSTNNPEIIKSENWIIQITNYRLKNLQVASKFQMKILSCIQYYGSLLVKSSTEFIKLNNQ